MIQTNLRRRPSRLPDDPTPADAQADPIGLRLERLNQMEANLAAAAGLLEQSRQEEFIPDYDQRLNRAQQELRQAQAAVATRKYRLLSRRAAPAPADAAATPPPGPATPQIRDCHG